MAATDTPRRAALTRDGARPDAGVAVQPFTVKGAASKLQKRLSSRIPPSAALADMEAMAGTVPRDQTANRVGPEDGLTGLTIREGQQVFIGLLTGIEDGVHNTSMPSAPEILAEGLRLVIEVAGPEVPDGG